MAVLAISRPGYTTIALALCLFCAYGVSVSQSSSDCDEDDIEKAVEICHKAFSDTIEEHMANIKSAPKRKGCCLSSSLGTCIKYAYSETDCDDEEDQLETIIHNETVKAQLHINKLASYVGTILCGEIKREHCGESLLHNFDEALKEIDDMNGAHNLRLSIGLGMIAILVYVSIGLGRI